MVDKEVVRERKRQYYLRNGDKIREKQREYYYKNKEYILKRDREKNRLRMARYYEENKNECRKKQNKWREEHREYVNKQAREYAHKPSYKKRRKKYKLENKEYNNKKRSELRHKKTDWLSDYKKKHRCKICGENDSIVLVFHHKDMNDKEFTISQNIDKSWNKLKAEVKKCDVLCVNCHHEVHFNIDKKVKRKNRRDEPSEQALRVRAYRKNKNNFLDNYKESRGCYICGESRRYVLEIHHKEEKKFLVNKACSKSKDLIKKELNNCKVICGNCHQKLHWSDESD
ncbi:MAG: hypothetical protein PHQ86_07995 [Dehalococcoidales bacterium]|nr:hypothetical protein [Dehalococcoidales bacterium]